MMSHGGQSEAKLSLGSPFIPPVTAAVMSRDGPGKLQATGLFVAVENLGRLKLLMLNK